MLTGLMFVIVLFFGYWLNVVVVSLLDLFLPMSVLEKYKIQFDKFNRDDLYKLSYYTKPMKIILCNQLFICTPILLVIGIIYDRVTTCNPTYNPTYIPVDVSMDAMFWYTCVEYISTTIILIIKLIICVFSEDVLFYYFHRLFHTKWLYGLVHKQHHEYNVPIAISAQYVHPIEQITLLIQLFTGPLIVKLNPVITCYLLLFYVTMNVLTHSGYKIPFIDTNYHDSHHKHFNINYGSMYFLDMLHGTYSVTSHYHSD